MFISKVKQFINCLSMVDQIGGKRKGGKYIYKKKCQSGHKKETHMKLGMFVAPALLQINLNHPL